MKPKLHQLPHLLLFLFLCCLGTLAKAEAIDTLQRLQKAYPEHVQSVTSSYLIWKDGTRLPIEGSYSLFDKIVSLFSHVDSSGEIITQKDILQERFEPVLRRMYGSSANEVKKNLTTIYWMPNIFGKRYPLRVTTINDVAKKLQRISAELEKLPPSYFKYLSNPAGCFYWRKVEGESYLSSHSFGIAIDINSHYSNYWLWDYLKSKRSISELTLQNHNHIPQRIVEIFAKEGFYWGGNWYYYDTMHFEYRPDLFM